MWGFRGLASISTRLVESAHKQPLPHGGMNFEDSSSLHTYLPCELADRPRSGRHHNCNPSCIPRIREKSPMSVTPTAVAAAVAATLMDRAHTFINWEGGFTYGGAVTAVGVAEAAKLINRTDRGTAEALISALDSWLDKYLAAPGALPGAVDCGAKQPYGASNKTRSCAWALLHRKNVSSASLPADEFGTVGDQLGSFPLAYLDRYLSRGGSDADAKVATSVVLDFVRNYPYRIHDPARTVSRTGGCCSPCRRQRLPCMGRRSVYGTGLNVTSRSSCRLRGSRHRFFLRPATAESLINQAAAMQLAYSKYLRVAAGPDADGLSAHGAWVGDDGTLKRSCCKWGRANGWGALSRVEILTAIDEAFPNHSSRQHLVQDFVDFMDALVSVQNSTDGRWHQLMDIPTTYLETSATAMSVTALAKGVTHSWFGSQRVDKYIKAARAGWIGLVKAVNMTDGTVSGVCQGTGIMPNASACEAGDAFADSAPGGVSCAPRSGGHGRNGCQPDARPTAG